jgi:transposase, IS5 family
MLMSTARDERQKDLFRPALDSIIDMHQPLVRLAQRIDWTFLERRLGGVYKPGPGQPPLPVRLMAGLMTLKHMESLPGPMF